MKSNTTLAILAIVAAVAAAGLVTIVSLSTLAHADACNKTGLFGTFKCSPGSDNNNLNSPSRNVITHKAQQP
jgi:hypothetical protein